MPINFCNSSFAIGESAKEHGVRYLNQIKARNTEIVYHTGNVLFATAKKAGNFLGFEFLETGNERDHLKTQSDKEQEKGHKSQNQTQKKNRKTVYANQ